MTATPTSSRVEFGGFTFDEDAGTLLKAGRAVPLSDKGIAALRLLIRKRPGTVRKEEFLDLIWPDTDVEVNSVAAVIADLRKALGDTRETPRFVQTHFRSGYRFIGEVRDLAASQAPELNHSQCWLQWRDQRFKLSEGESIVGRDPRHPIWLDHPTVSRVHAAILVRESQVSVEDRNSKHGTFVEESQISTVHPLSDGDIIRFGGARVAFRRSDTLTVPTMDLDDAAPRGRKPVRKKR